MADLTIIAVAEYDDGDSESFGTTVTDADVVRGQLEETVGDALIDAGENMTNNSIKTVDEFVEWARETDGGVVSWTNSVEIDGIPKGETYAYTSNARVWNGVAVPDGWVKEQSETGGYNFRKEANTTTIDESEWYVTSMLNKGAYPHSAPVVVSDLHDDYVYLFSRNVADLPLAVGNRLDSNPTEHYAISKTEMISALEDNL
jgi:hypothetical protein